LHAYTARKTTTRGPAHSNDESFAFAALCDSCTSAHGVVGTRGVVDACERGASEGFDEIVFNVLGMVVEDFVGAETTAVVEVSLACDCDYDYAGGVGELDCC
jgi:hypothetical protein